MDAFSVNLTGMSWIPQIPVCPVCRKPGELPGTPIVVANADGSFSGATLPGAVLFVCTGCGNLFAGFVETSA